MRRFQATPQKKLLGMVILFVLVPLFLVWYWVFFLDHKPGNDTSIIIVASLLLAAYFYLKNRGMVNEFVFGRKKEDVMAEQASENPFEEDSVEEFDGDSVEVDSGDEEIAEEEAK